MQVSFIGFHVSGAPGLPFFPWLAEAFRPNRIHQLGGDGESDRARTLWLGWVEKERFLAGVLWSPRQDTQYTTVTQSGDSIQLDVARLARDAAELSFFVCDVTTGTAVMQCHHRSPGPATLVSLTSKRYNERCRVLAEQARSRGAPETEFRGSPHHRYFSSADGLAETLARFRDGRIVFAVTLAGAATEAGIDAAIQSERHEFVLKAVPPAPFWSRFVSQHAGGRRKDGGSVYVHGTNEDGQQESVFMDLSRNRLALRRLEHDIWLGHLRDLSLQVGLFPFTRDGRLTTPVALLWDTLTQRAHFAR